MKLVSQLDQSVNFVQPASVGYFEARYVRRVERYFSLYLSSQSGCNRGCRMCHLTATKQTKLVNAMPHEYIAQADQVFAHYETQPAAEMVHYNFMARGEVFDNKDFLLCAGGLLPELAERAQRHGLLSRFLLSTIMPDNYSLADARLARFFPTVAPEIYYSIYSVDPAFRAKWLPNAMPVERALSMLKQYQDDKRVLLKFHWAFIAGENDSYLDVMKTCHAIKFSGIRGDINIVRYNTADPQLFGVETSDEVLAERVREMQEHLPECDIKVITRVGMDVQASCGMFVGKDAK